MTDMKPRKTRPGRTIIEYGVVMDDQDSIDTYSTYDEAADAFQTHGGEALVHIVTTIAAYVLPDPMPRNMPEQHGGRP